MKIAQEFIDRFMDYLRCVQQDDLICNSAMTDIKGDRSLRPNQLADPDLYLRVVDRRPEGIVVLGAIFSHEIILIARLR
jgi:aromatic ring hydroxylase